MQLLQSGIDVSNVDQFGDLYSKFNANAPDISALINKQNIENVRASAVRAVAEARAKSQIQLQRIKNNANGGDPGSVEPDDSSFILQMDSGLYGNDDGGA